MPRLVDELGGGDDLALARQPDDPVAQLLALQQHEDDQDDRQRQLAEVLQQRAEERAQPRHPGGPLRLEDHGGRRRRCRRARSPRSPSAASPPAPRGAPLPSSVTSLIISSSRPVPSVAFLTDSHLVLDRLPVLGQLLEQVADLGGDQPADAAQRGRRQQDDHDHRRRPRQPALAEPVDQGAQQERQEGRQRHRDEDRLGPVERPDHDHATTVPVSVRIARCQPAPTVDLLTICPPSVVRSLWIRRPLSSSGPSRSASARRTDYGSEAIAGPNPSARDLQGHFSPGQIGGGFLRIGVECAERRRWRGPAARGRWHVGDSR